MGNEDGMGICLGCARQTESNADSILSRYLTDNVQIKHCKNSQEKAHIQGSFLRSYTRIVLYIEALVLRQHHSN
jgi:hypothetical protein